MGIQEKTIGIAPVGCSVFAYNYFDIDMQEAAHGRAPALATAVKRLMPDKVVFTYQGDGDLAAIGTAETIHACNRGENIVIFFVNNGIYGMTGGQMAPTTLEGMKTATCPYGRNTDMYGFPLRISDLLKEIDGTCYVTRQSVHKTAGIVRAKKAIRKATIDNLMVPVLCGTSYRNKGVQQLLDAVVDYMPAPTDIEAIKGVNPDTEEEETRPSDDKAPFAALAFKIATDPFVGKLCFFRVYSGSVEAGATVFNSVKDNKERMGRILQMHANHRQDIDVCYAGDIAAAVGLKNTTTGDTLCDEKHPIILESMEFPEPVIRVAIEPKTKAGQEKMGIALAKLAEEDPTFKTYTDEETGQTIIAGMGELHLEIIVDRLLREFKVEANVGAPQVAYRETVKANADVDMKYARQSGGKGQYGHVKIRLTPNEPGKGYEFINSIVGGSIPKEYIGPVDQGIQGAMQAGVLAGYPVVDVKVELYDGSYHEVDSSEMAFKIAASMAFKEAMRKANPVILEPVMKVSTTVPDDYMGDVMGDFNSRRGMIQGTETRTGATQINALVPLQNMFGYATDLRSKTQGRGNYAMEPSHYTEVPKSIAEGIMSSRAKKD